MKNFTHLFFLSIFLAATAPQTCIAQPLVNQGEIDSLANAVAAYNYEAATLSPAGGLYVVMDGYVSGIQADAGVLYIDSFGNVDWTTILNYNSVQQSYITGICYKSGYVYVTGFTVDSAAQSSLYTAKLNSATGDTVWTRNFHGTYSGYSSGASLVVDDTGYIYVVGTEQMAATDFAMLELKLDGSGNQLWSSVYDSSGFYSGGVALALNPGGNDVVATGFTGSGFGSWQFLTVWNSFSTGAKLNVAKSSNGSGNFFAKPISIIRDQTGEIIVIGSAPTAAGGSCLKLVAYDSTFAQIWVSTYGDTTSSSSIITATAATNDQNGHILVSGTANNSSGGTDQVIATFLHQPGYTTDGNLNFARRISAPNPALTAGATAITADNNDNVIVSGKMSNGSHLAMTTMSLDINSGNTLWQKTYNRAANTDDSANAVVIDNNNNVIVFGTSTGTDTIYDMVQYQQWSPTPCSDPSKLSPGDSSACPTITYNFENGHITTAGADTFVEFDIYALQNTPSLAFSAADIIFTYNTTAFGTNVVDSSNITVTRGTIITDTNYVISLTDTLMKSDVVPPGGGEVWLSIAAAQDTSHLYAISDTLKQLCHVKMKMKAVTNFGVRFDQFFMQSQSNFVEYSSALYNYVYTGGQLAESEEDNDVDLTYSIVNMALDTTVNPPNLTFDIVANASDDVPLEDADIWVQYNPSTLNFGAIGPANWFPATGDNGNYTTTINASSGELEILIQADNLPTAFHNITTSNTPETIASIVMSVINCSGEDGLALDSNQMEEASDFLDDSANTLSYYNVICTPTSSGNNQACTQCPGTDVDFSFSNGTLTYDTSGPGANGGKLQFTVNYSPNSTQFTSGLLFSTTVIIDYNNTIFGDIVSNPDFKITLDASLISDNFITTINSFDTGQFSVALQQVGIPLAFTFGQSYPLFTVTMPFDNSNVNCNNSSQVQFDVAMNSDSGAGQVLTYYDTTTSTANPNTFCTENIVNNDTLYNTNPCGNPVITNITAGIYGDQCPTAGSMIPIQIIGAHFLNGYQWTKLDTNFAGYLTFINADQGDYCTTCTTPNTLSSGWAAQTNTFDILNWTDTLIQLIAPTWHEGFIQQGDSTIAIHETAGSGPFQVTAPSGQLSPGTDSIYIEYAVQNSSLNDINFSADVPVMEYLTSTQTAAADTPYSNFPLYTFDFNDDLATNPSAVAAVAAAISDIQCTIKAPFYIDSNWESNVLNNNNINPDTLAKYGVNEILLVDSTNGIIQSVNNTTTLGVTIVKGHISSCHNYFTNSPNYSADNPIGYFTIYEKSINIYIDETPPHPYTYATTGDPGNTGHYSFLTVIEHEFGHGMLLGHSNHNPFLTAAQHGNGDDNNRIMYYQRHTGEPYSYFYEDPDDARGAIRVLQWPTNADSQNYNGIILFPSCDTVVLPAIPTTIEDCIGRLPGPCGTGDPIIWENIPKNENINFGVTVFPNPTQDNAILQIDIYENADFNIRVFDIVGNEIYETQKSSSIPFQVPINMEQFATGVYIINVWCSNGRQQSLKLIKTYLIKR